MKPGRGPKRGDPISARKARETATQANLLGKTAIGPNLELKKTGSGFALNTRTGLATAAPSAIRIENWLFLDAVDDFEDQDYWRPYEVVHDWSNMPFGFPLGPEDPTQRNKVMFLRVPTDIQYISASGRADSYQMWWKYRVLCYDDHGHLIAVSAEMPFTHIITEAKPCPP